MTDEIKPCPCGCDPDGVSPPEITSKCECGYLEKHIVCDDGCLHMEAKPGESDESLVARWNALPRDSVPYGLLRIHVAWLRQLKEHVGGADIGEMADILESYLPDSPAKPTQEKS